MDSPDFVCFRVGFFLGKKEPWLCCFGSDFCIDCGLPDFLLLPRACVDWNCPLFVVHVWRGNHKQDQPAGQKGYVEVIDLDVLNFVLAIALIIAALQYGQNWIVFALIILSVLTFNSFRIALALIAAAVIIYFAFASDDLFQNFPLVLVGLLVVGLILGIGKKPEQPESYLPGGLGGYDDLLGGGYA